MYARKARILCAEAMSFGFVNPAIGGGREGCCALVIASVVTQFLSRWLLSMRRERVQRKTLTSRRPVLIGTRRLGSILHRARQRQLIRGN
jgi:hypothetical protein